MVNLRLRVVDKVVETSDACTFSFENTTGNTLFYKPGQFLTVILELKGEEYRRSYSLCTVPVKDKFPAITVKRVQGGLVSNYLLDHLKVGDMLECLHPAGTFTPVLDSKNKKEYFLFAAGSGITPLFSIMQTILLKEPHSNVHLIYCNRNVSSIIYKSKLDELELQFLDHLKVVHVLSKPSEAWSGFGGRLTNELVQNLVSELSQTEKSNVLFYLCGPSGFMHTCKSAIENLGFMAESIKKEDFASTKNVEADISFVDNDKQVKLFYNGKEYEFLVPNGKSILKGAQENGIRLPYSCESGFCTACIGTCTEGEVDISASDVLSENEKKQGYVLTCIGKPVTKKVVIRID